MLKTRMWSIPESRATHCVKIHPPVPPPQPSSTPRPLSLLLVVKHVFLTVCGTAGGQNKWPCLPLHVLRLPIYMISPSLCFPPYRSPIAPTPKHTLWLKHPNNWPLKAMGHHNDNHKKLKANLRKWAVLTMLIGTELNAPIEHKHRIHTS